MSDNENNETANSKPTNEGAQSLTERTTLKAKVKVADTDKSSDTNQEIKIKAQPSPDNSSCTFMINRPLIKRLSWVIKTKSEAEKVPLALEIFKFEWVKEITIIDTNIKVTKKSNEEKGWNILAKEIGGLLRKFLASGQDIIDKSIIDNMPSEEDFTDKISNIIETEINPGVAAHEGNCTLEKVEGNTIYISMGGGCQGCSAAGDTLKFGIEKAFRDKVPYIGAVLDDTDHDAGMNPYFS